MNSDSIEQPADLIGSATERLAGPLSVRERSFYAALALAFLLHASMLLGLIKAPPRIIGDENGSTKAIEVSVISAEDFLSKTTVPVTAESAPGAPGKPAPPPAEQSPPQQPQLEAAAKPELKPALEPDDKPVEKPPEKTEAKPQDKPVEKPEDKQQEAIEAKPDPVAEAKPSDTEPLALEKDNPDLFKLTVPVKEPPKPQREADPQQSQPAKKPPQKQIAKLDLSTPSIGSPRSASGGGGATFARPPGITRSGANDDFARGVIRALQKTMPPHTGIFGRVTVRIILNQNGDVTEVQMLSGAKEPSLGQEVVFAARATTYPFPPANSLSVDRIFFITYIYN